MKKYNWLSYFLYAVVLIGYIAFSNTIVISLREQSAATFEVLPFFLGITIIYIFLGVLLGLDKLLVEIKKEGNWRLNWPKFIFLGLPFLYLSLGVFIGYIPIDFIQQTIIYPMIFVRTGDFLSVYQMILGYIVCTSFIKVQD